MDGKPRDFRLIVNLQEGGKVGGRIVEAVTRR